MKRNYAKWYLYAACLALPLGIPQVVHASSNEINQNSVLRGTVVDANGEPVIGASVVVVGSSVRAVTDLDGKFQIACKAGTTLKVSYIGYVSQNIKLVLI